MQILDAAFLRGVEPQRVDQVDVGIGQLRHVRSQVELDRPAVRIHDVKRDLPIRLLRQPLPGVADLLRLVVRRHHR
jgi:hypothetical protein